jgi:hypothetical protein
MLNSDLLEKYMGDRRNTYQVLVKKREGKRALERPLCRKKGKVCPGRGYEGPEGE